ncbi:MAG: cytochrome-c peroxidase [Planctomycetota bacterium]
MNAVGCSGDSSETQSSTAETFDPVLLAAIADAEVTPLPLKPLVDTALVDLGRSLFFDQILGGNQNISCASCHRLEAGLGDGLPVAVGEGAVGTAPARTIGTGRLIARNAPALFNLSGQSLMFHDGRVAKDPAPGSAEAVAEQITTATAAQALHPVLDRDKMRGLSGENPLANVADNDPLPVWALIMDRIVGASNGTVGGIAEYRT